MTISYVVLFVKNMEKSLQIYGKCLGLEINQRYRDGDADVAFLVEPGFEPLTQQPLLEIVCDPRKEMDLSSVFIGFEVEDVRKTAEMMCANGSGIINEPYSPGPDVMIMTMEGPDHETIEIMQHIKAE